MNTPDLTSAARRLENLGFLADSGLIHRGEGAFLIVALRATPSRHHFDPESVEYWITVAGVGRPARLERDTQLPCRAE